MLCYYVHTHKGKPRDKNTAVKRDEIELHKCFVCEQVHADNAHDKERYRRRRDAPQKRRRFLYFPF
jgi:hypothetical protein